MANLVDVMRSYMDRMLRDIPGMKVLLLDADTLKAVSTVFSQSEGLANEVYLVQRLDADMSEQLFHMKAVCFLRPSRENVAKLRRELRDPRFGEYHLFFTNRLDDLRLQDLAEGDARELVKQVQELYGDVVVLDPHHFVVPLTRPHVLLQPFNWEYGHSTDAVARLTEGLASVILSLRRRFQIRYQAGSEGCEKVAQALHHLTTVDERELFDYGRPADGGSAVLLLLDRRDDPVTPLLTQWTFQAMVHELIGSDCNRVSLAHVPGVKPEYQEVVLAAHQDPFFASHMYSNFGDLGMAVKGLVDEYQAQHKTHTNIVSIEDMLNFVDNYGEFNAQQRNTGKHVSIMSELSRLVQARNLMQVSSLEQELACSSAIMTAFDSVLQMLPDHRLSDLDRLRLVMLFALRYEKEGRQQTASLMSKLQELGMEPALINAVRTLLRVCGTAKRVGDLYSDKTLTSRFTNLAKQHLKGVENVYTQHTPLLLSTLESLARGRLRAQDYPCTDQGGAPLVGGRAPKLVLVCMVGGTTYEEAKAVAELNAAGERGEGWSAGMRVLLGGSAVLNSRAFVKELLTIGDNERYQ